MHALVAMVDPEQRRRIAALFGDAGHHAATTGDAAETLRVAAAEPFELVVLDGTDENFDGASLIDALRLNRPELAILLITAPGDVDARVLGLTRGADDALEAAFAPSQLMARAGALTRRAARAPRAPELLTVDGCELDLGAHVARRGAVRVQLTAREVGLLRWLHRHQERAVGRPELLEHVWGLSPLMETRTVDMAISGLRKKIERDPSSPRIVQSVRGAGYRFGGA
jgi:two-component system, OmpR family, response regulator